MIEDFKMEMSQGDFLRVVNAGVRELSRSALANLIKWEDVVTDVHYSCHTKQYTLIFSSGRELRIEKARKKKEAAKK